MIGHERSEWVLLCVDSLHPIDPGNYEGPIHCTAHPEGHACVTARYQRVPYSTMTEAERNRLADNAERGEF